MSNPAISRFADHVPARPYCTDELSAGLRIRPREVALKKAYVQPNGSGMVWTVPFDVDRQIVNPDDWWPVWDTANLPPPNLAVQTISTGRGHLLYLLDAGVCTTSAARSKPMAYLRVPSELRLGNVAVV